MNYYNNNSYTRENSEEELYPLSRQSLNRAADDEGIDRINWKAWNESVNRVKQQIKQMKHNKPHFGGKPSYQVIQYDKNMLPIRKYDRLSDVTKRGFKIASVCNAIRTGRLFMKKYYFKKN